MNPDYNESDYNRRSSSILWLTVVAVSLVALIGAIAYILGTNQNDTGVVPGVGGGPGETSAPEPSPSVSPTPTSTQTPVSY